jgi:outer membrane lipoprotein-sorting protein
LIAGAKMAYKHIMRLFLTALIFMTLLLPAAAFADDPERQAAVQSVEDYLGGLSTLKARFVQIANDGKQAQGAFYLKRPGRMRIDYDPPVKDFIVADGALIYYYDGEMKQVSDTPISKSLADFFLRKELRLSGDVSVSDVKKDESTLQLTIVQTSNPLAGSLTLVLSDNPLQLQSWRVVDSQGLVTEVKLLDIETGIRLDSNLFHYYDPAHKAHLYNDK